jgi:integrase
LGHASVNLTQNTYIHVIPGMHQQAVRNMGELLRTSAG